jgi:hypothetical protein
MFSGSQLGHGFKLLAEVVEQCFGRVRHGHVRLSAAETVSERGVVTDRLDKVERAAVTVRKRPGT